MIRLENVTYSYVHNKPVIKDLTIDLPSDRRLALLGPADSGKTTLLRLFSGVIDPVHGRIERRTHLSYPAGYSRAFRFSLALRQNLVFAARVYNADPDEVVDFVASLLDLSDELDRPMRDLPIPTRLAVSFALTYALPFDTYLFDNTIGPGDPSTRHLWRQLYDARTAKAGAILATRQARTVANLCDCGLVLRNNAPAVFCDNITDAIALLEEDTAITAAAAASGTVPANGNREEQPAVLKAKE